MAFTTSAVSFPRPGFTNNATFFGYCETGNLMQRKSYAQRRSPEKTALYHCGSRDSRRLARVLLLRKKESRQVTEVERPGTQRGHDKKFLAVPATPSSASAFL